MTRRIVLEVGVTSPEEAFRAQAAGADRIELCAGLEVGGLTPSPGTFLAVREAVQLHVYVLLRARTGGFTYPDEQFEAMRRDGEWFMKNGANGIVVGILQTVDGVNRIDRERCRLLVHAADGQAVFHRAFDFVSDTLGALDELAGLGFKRVQTSGGFQTAEAGSARLAACVAHAGKRIEVMPAGGITPVTVDRLLRETGADQVHGSFRCPVPDPSLGANQAVARGMGGPDSTAGWSTTSAEIVQRMRKAIDRFAAQ